jgi:hypothetical protein
MSRPRSLLLAVVAFGALVTVVGWWLGHAAAVLERPNPASVGAPVDPAPASLTFTEPAPTIIVDASAFRPPATTVRDRAVRDEVRRRILAAWLLALPAADAAPPDATFYAPMPLLDGGTVDPVYLRERIREDFIPMARQCYDQLLARSPGVAGRAVAEFVIVGDERVGGVADEVSVDPGDGGLADPGFATCLRESLSTVAFRPPPGRGSLRVRYPFTFAPDAPDASAR